MQYFGIAVGCMGIAPETFWNGITMKEWWSAYGEFTNLERMRAGIVEKDEAEPSDEEFNDLLEQERAFQRRKRLKEKK